MEHHLIDDLAYKEKFYWWHRVRRHNLVRILNPHIGHSSRVLEIGSGTGANLRVLRTRCAMGVGLDLDTKALAYCRDLLTVRGDATEPLPFAHQMFDAVVLLDVLEHIRNQRFLVGEIWRVLRSRGVSLVMVPAGPGLWSYWDEMHGHQRRYTKRSLKKVFEGPWVPRYLEYSFSWMYPVVWFFRKMMQRRRLTPGHSDFIELPRPLNALLVLAGKVEAGLQPLCAAPIGTTLCGLWVKDGSL
jgi:SAM-dependent methyltransferase